MATEIFEQDVFVFLDKPSDKDEHDKLLDTLSDLGGTVARSINKKTTIAICNDNSLTSEIEKAEKLDIPVVKKEFITESITQSKRLDPKDYLLKNDKKRKDMDGDDTASGATTNGDTKDDAESALKKAKVDTYKAFEPGCVWCGTLMDLEAGESHPMFVRILKFDEKSLTLEGETEWPTLENSKSKFRATIKDGVLTLDDYEPIDNDVLEPTVYVLKIVTNATNGKVTLDGKTEDEKCTVKLMMSKKEKIVHLPFLTVGKECDGQLVQDFAMSLKVTGRKTEKMLEGTIDWTSFSTKTKFKGTVDGNTVKFTEYEVISGDGVDLPVEYNGQLQSSTSPDSLITGDYKLESGIAGKFTLEKA
ncbi:hypothetical protein PPL_06815 [Heterostelium album PN500]|uniref:BRCT domain-containing protein n=1 Tax=Heterostelium pallidum (strain ATCC 26659 / Pp 5 / PN500) TaxID=670386 RepID=D3BDL3_HETP5|nr:hypothetical protein PPL_06815 [Heterostelium album PN500]EFA79994.1 hypothetical protein PPL_06815 [Heterostelium album PN500]|eukprot:XP_020432114.1 hypothetical protein PPL_06815 [Heterostelium album PN500]